MFITLEEVQSDGIFYDKRQGGKLIAIQINAIEAVQTVDKDTCNIIISNESFHVKKSWEDVMSLLVGR